MRVCVTLRPCALHAPPPTSPWVGVQVVHLLSRVLVGLVDSCAYILMLGDARSERVLSALLFVNQDGELGCRELVAEVWPR